MRAARSSRAGSLGARGSVRSNAGALGRRGAEASAAGLTARRGAERAIELGAARPGASQPFKNTKAAPRAGAIATRPGALAFAQFARRGSETAMSPAIQPSSAAPIATGRARS